jgi:hypothetical protein
MLDRKWPVEEGRAQVSWAVWHRRGDRSPSATCSRIRTSSIGGAGGQHAQANEQVARHFCEDPASGRPGSFYPCRDDGVLASEPFANDRALLFLVGRNWSVFASPLRSRSSERVSSASRPARSRLWARAGSPARSWVRRSCARTRRARCPGFSKLRRGRRRRRRGGYRCAGCRSPICSPDFVVWDEVVAPARGRRRLCRRGLPFRAGGFFSDKGVGVAREDRRLFKCAPAPQSAARGSARERGACCAIPARCDPLRAIG